MSYKTILVHIDVGKHNEKHLETAIHLAKQYDACLVGFYTFTSYIPPAYVIDEMGEGVAESQAKIAFESMSRAEEAFRSQTLSAGLDKIEWCVSYDDHVNVMSRAHCADLVVVSQSDATCQSNVPMDFPEHLVLTAGRPVLILPNSGDYSPIGRHVLIAWNASKEAARAVSDSLPLLKSACRVFIVSINSKAFKSDTIPTEHIIHYLEQHGIHAELKEHTSVAGNVGKQLLACSAELEADLVVMGCYGHSQFKEWILGGATRTILESMTIPALMSH